MTLEESLRETIAPFVGAPLTDATRECLAAALVGFNPANPSTPAHPEMPMRAYRTDRPFPSLVLVDAEGVATNADCLDWFYVDSVSRLDAGRYLVEVAARMPEFMSIEAHYDSYAEAIAAVDDLLEDLWAELPVAFVRNVPAQVPTIPWARLRGAAISSFREENETAGVFSWTMVGRILDDVQKRVEKHLDPATEAE